VPSIFQTSLKNVNDGVGRDTPVTTTTTTTAPVDDETKDGNESSGRSSNEMFLPSRFNNSVTCKVFFKYDFRNMHMRAVENYIRTKGEMMYRPSQGGLVRLLPNENKSHYSFDQKDNVSQTKFEYIGERNKKVEKVDLNQENIYYDNIFALLNRNNWHSVFLI
jgi:hypothetical protein